MIQTKEFKQLATRRAVVVARRKEIAAMDEANVSGKALDEFDALEVELNEIDGKMDSLVRDDRAAISARFRASANGDKEYRVPTVSPPGSSTFVPQKSASTLFEGERLETHGFSGVADVARAVLLGDSTRLNMLAGQSVGIPSDGGYLVPTAFASEMLDGSVESEVVRPRCRVFAMPGPDLVVSDFDDSTHADGKLFGGLEGEWMSEGGEADYKVAKMRQLNFKAKKLGFLTSATNELLADAPGFEGRFAERMTQAIGWNLDRACLITGTGAGQPMSCLNATSTITVAKETGQAADTIVWENIQKMAARLHPACWSRSSWVISQTALPQLLNMTVAVGTGGAFIPALTSLNGTPQLLGRPVIFSEKMNPVGDLGDILLVDFSKYSMGVMRNGMRLDRSMHVRFSTDETVWRLILRVDAMPIWSKAFTPVNGDSLSWAVTLAARA